MFLLRRSDRLSPVQLHPFTATQPGDLASNQSHIYQVAEWGEGRTAPQVRELPVWSSPHPTT